MVPLNSPLALSVVATGAPIRSANLSKTSPASIAPRPARINGRRAEAIMPIALSRASPSPGMVDRSGMSIWATVYWVFSHIMADGMFSTIGRRSSRARRKAVATSTATVAGVFICSNPAPVASINARWDMACWWSGSSTGVSPQRSTIGIVPFVPSISAVTALETAGPWVIVTAPTSPVTEA